MDGRGEAVLASAEAAPAEHNMARFVVSMLAFTSKFPMTTSLMRPHISGRCLAHNDLRLTRGRQPMSHSESRSPHLYLLASNDC